MAAYFLDSSAVVKRYAVETGSKWITALTDPAAGNTCWIAAITRVELLAALYLKVRMGTVTLPEAQQAEQVFRHELSTHYRVISLTTAILDRAMELVAKRPLFSERLKMKRFPVCREMVELLWLVVDFAGGAKDGQTTIGFHG